MNRPVAVAVFACLLGLSQASCAILNQLFQKPTVSLTNVSITSLSLTGISANFILGVTNPNPIPLDLASLGYQITVDGHQFAAGAANAALSVPANGVGQVTLPIGIKFAEFAASLEALFSKETVAYGLDTNLGFGTPIGIVTVPLSTSGTFPVPKLPTLSLGAASVGAIDFTGATLSLGLIVSNRNTFALPLGGLDYKVSIGGNPIIQNVTAPQSLAAGATHTIPIAARIDFLKTGLGIMSAIKGGGATVAFDGALDLGVYKHPVHLEQKLGN